jgi:hypothetical protein
MFFFLVSSPMPLFLALILVFWPTWLFTVVPAARQGAGSASWRQVRMHRRDGAPGCRPATQPLCVLRGHLQVEHSTPLGQDRPRVPERLDIVVRRARSEPRPQNPASLLDWAVVILPNLDEEQPYFNRAKVMRSSG